MKKNFEQISNKVYCSSFLNNIDIPTKILPNPYLDYPYLIIKDFLGEDICNEINNSIREKSNFISAKLRNIDIAIEEVLDTNIRDTKLYELSDLYKNIYLNRFKQIQNQIEDFFSLALTTSTDIQVLEYKKGSFYKAHSDDSSMIYKDDKLVGFVPVAPQRKITTVLFTTNYDLKPTQNSFLGGELKFNYLYDENFQNIEYKPSKGDMLIFLSNPYFTHEVMEVKDGYRLTLVQWHDALKN